MPPQLHQRPTLTVTRIVTPNRDRGPDAGECAPFCLYVYSTAPLEVHAPEAAGWTTTGDSLILIRHACFFEIYHGC